MLCSVHWYVAYSMVVDFKTMSYIWEILIKGTGKGV